MRRTTRLGRYHLTERMAYGGMAEIFRGFTFDQEGLRHDVAIKKLLPNYAEDVPFIHMLTDEYKLLRHLRHPNVAEVFELSDVEGSLLIAMELVDGKDLRSTVEKSRRLPVRLKFDDIAYVLVRALDGLHHAHRARDEAGTPLRIVHRDFSPSNILVSYDGHIKICDFGIAKAVHNRVQTKAGVIKGKVKYMSPEQAFGRSLDPRSDVFSAGSVLYELCTGRPAFDANTEVDLIFAVREAIPMPCRQANPKIPAALAAVIERAMQRPRSRRYQSAREFRDALLRFLSEHRPDYRRTRMARFMKHVWAQEIEQELRALEEYVIDLESSSSFGNNLLADDLGPDARYVGFTPHPTSSRSIEPPHQSSEPTIKLGRTNRARSIPPDPSSGSPPDSTS